MSNNEIIKRVFYKIEVENISPISVSNGENELTDSDLIRNADGDCFVPGTSLAGAFRNALRLDKKTKCIMGYSDGEEGKMSGVFISDLFFDTSDSNGINISVRDGVQLEKKVVSNKFDMEIIETGATGSIFISFIVRKGELETEYIDSIDTIIMKIENGDIRIGRNKNRGFGRLKIRNISVSIFSRDNLTEYIDFKNRFKDEDTEYQVIKKYDEWIVNRKSVESDYVWITVPLKLYGGISIRRYSTIPGKADYSHITCNGKPVIPGSSWNGAIRSEACKILKEVGCTNVQAAGLIKDWFGGINENISKSEDKNIHQSRIVIGESIIENSKPLPMKRNRINRFDASTCDGAFYSEISYFGGNTNLQIGIKKDDGMVYFEILGIMDMIVSCIQHGNIAVGGQTAVGRGIFEPNGNVTYSEELPNDYSSALYRRIKEIQKCK